MSEISQRERELLAELAILRRRVAREETKEFGAVNATNIASTIHAATLDTTPLDADEVPGLDSSASFALVRWTWTTIKAFLKTYFDTLYNLYVHPNHTGDVTSVADGATTIGALKVQTGMVAASAITYAKIQNVSATDKVLGRSTAGAGVIEEIVLTAYARTLIAAIDAAAGRTVLALGTMAVEAAATYGPLAAANTWAGTNKFDDVVTLSAGGTQDYEFTNSTTVLRLQSKTAGAEGHFWFFTNDGDGTDSINISMYGVGTPSASANRERLRLMWNQPNSAYEIFTEADGTGTLRPLVLYTEGNTNQLHLDTSGNVGVGLDPTAKLDILQATLGSAVLRLASTATNDDPTEEVVQNRVTTTDATVTTIHTFDILTSQIVLIEVNVVARRTGGTSGTSNDGAGYNLRGTYHLNGLGSAEIIGGISKTANESQVAWDINFTPSGTDVLLQVTGAANNNITWHMTARTWKVTS